MTDVSDSLLPSPSDSSSPSGWRTVSIITWLLTFAATTAVAISSRTIGRPVWWLGSASDPAPDGLIIVPIALTVVPIVVSARHVGRAGVTGIACSLALGAIALGDIGDNQTIALAMGGVAICALVANIAVWAGLRQYG